MKQLIFLLFFLLSPYAKAQFPLDFFIHKSDDAVVVCYAEHISEPAKNKSQPRPTSITYDINPITIEISPCTATQELFLCQEDSVNFSLDFHFDKTIKCTKITVESTSNECLNTYFEAYITSTNSFKWKLSSEGKKITSVPFRIEEIHDETIIYYLEATIENGQIVLEEKNSTKSAWKKLSKRLKKLK